MGNDTIQISKAALKKILVIVLVVLLVLSVTLNIVSYIRQKRAAAQIPAITPISDPEDLPVTPDITVTVQQIAEALDSAKDLVTSRYTYTNWDTFEKDHYIGSFKVPLTTDKTLFLYSGTVLLGINVSDIKPAIDNETKTITLALPEVRQIAHEIDEDSFQIFDIKDSVFTSTSMEEFEEVRKAMIEDQEKKLGVKLKDEGFYDEVYTNTKVAVREILEIAGLTEGYTLKFEKAA